MHSNFRRPSPPPSDEVKNARSYTSTLPMHLQGAVFN